MGKKNKERLDVLLVRRDFFPSREKAKRSVMAGLVLVDGERVDKPGTPVPLDAEIRILGEAVPYVSRGGLKLEKALREFNISLQGKVVLDIGASTGGFTDCALQHGAQKVIAVDVGYGQLAWKLRQDPRVINMERTNVRYLQPEQLPELPEVITVDVSFISLALVLPVAAELLKTGGIIIALVKPQFEAGREKVGKRGVVRDPQVHREVLQKIISTAQELNLALAGITFSPLKGPEGNIEYLLLLQKNGRSIPEDPVSLINSVVDQAWKELKT